MREWIDGARPRTLPAALSPVLVGTGAAVAMHGGHVGKALLALIVALALQVGVNYANDYSDGIRGTDEERVGPVRLVGQRLAEPGAVKRAAFIAFGVAAVAGLALVAWSGQWIWLVVGAAAIAAAWFYTGGKTPYGYLGLGEVFVFIFFGLVAVVGTTTTQAGAANIIAWLGAVGMGAFACVMLVVNNLRDIPGDTVAGKRTLAVRLGDQRTRYLFVGLIGLAYMCAVAIALLHLNAWLAMLSVIPAAVACARVLGGATGKDLIKVLSITGLAQLAYAVLLTIGLCF